MRKLIYYVATSVDGFIAHADGTWVGFVMEGEHASEYLATLKTYSAVVMGRRTWEIAPKMGVEDPYPYLDTYVYSRTMAPPACARVHLVREDAAGHVEALKAQPAENGSEAPIYLAGGGVFAGEMLAAGLVDEILVKLNPFVMGQGIRMVEGLPEPLDLTLAESKVYGSGVALMRYRVNPPRAGRP